ncbi:MAG: hypothetical protein CMQ54_02095 [Gammaproteobacteria bacterium]|nr:hypothetical protein [Gammaproteobacteria bacterium]
MKIFFFITRLAWGLWAWFSFIVACIFSLVVTIIVPGSLRRQKLVTYAAKAVFIFSGIKVSVNGINHIPLDGCVVIANHASYIDGILLNGYLPPRFGFVIKGEMRNFPVAHFLLRRSGSKFVERNEARGSSRDARQLIKAAKEGESLGFFPEGTFKLEPGIRRFRPGAFVAAYKAKIPVVPIAISGSRKMLPEGNLIPCPTHLIIDILPPIMPNDSNFECSKKLAEASRRKIISATGEPDLLLNKVFRSK